MTRLRYRSVIADSARWNGFELRSDDIVISTSPKCGTTWMQMICALLIFQEPDLPRPLTEISPWLDMSTSSLEHLVALLDAQEHRRFIKTHTPLDGLPFDERVTYLCVGRDPRDVALSMDNHMANIDLDALLRAREASVGLEDLPELMAHPSAVARSDDERERVLSWIGDDTSPTDQLSSLRGVLHHVDTFWQVRDRANVVLLHYADLQADLAGEMRRLAALLQIDVPDARWPALVEAATFGAMRSRSAELAPDVTNAIWQDTSRFFHHGTSGRGEALLAEEDQRRYDELIASRVTPDLAEWIHGGWRRATPRAFP